MTHYGFQRERQGYSVWTLSPHTRDRLDLVAYARTRKDALREVDQRYALDAEEEKRT